MYSFLVLGLIPGTNFQITFQVWLAMLVVVSTLLGTYKIYRLHHLQALPLPIIRQPLPASRLHQRGR